MNTGPAMRAQTQITTHSMARLQERLHVVQPLGALQVLQGRLGDLTAHVGMEYDDEDGEFCAFKLMYFPEVQDFGVLVVKTVLESDGAPAFHVLKTVITQGMCADKFARPIERRNYKRAAKLRLSPLEYRTWLHQTYGEREKPNDNQLNVVYRLGSQRKRIGVKIRPALCDAFKKNERIENSLAHPGALTRVHTVLEKFGLKFEDRLFMRFDSEHGQLKMEARSARRCPHCGMEPLESDRPDTKAQPATTPV